MKTSKHSLIVHLLIIIILFSLTIINLGQNTESKKLSIKKIKELDAGDFVSSTAFSPDSKIFASTGSDHSIKLWETQNWNLLFELKHSETPLNVIFSPDGNIIASTFSILRNGGIHQGYIWFWDLKTGNKVAEFSDENKSFTTIAFSPDGKSLAIGFVNGFVKLISIENLSNIKIINDNLLSFDSGISSISFSPDGNLIAIAPGKGLSGPKDGGTFKILEVKTGREVFTYSKFLGIFHAAFSPDRKILAVGGYNKPLVNNTYGENDLFFFNTQNWQIIEEKKNYPVAEGIEFSDSGNLLISGYPEAAIFDLGSKKSKKFDGESITSVSLSPNGKNAAVGDEKGKIRLYSISQ